MTQIDEKLETHRHVAGPVASWCNAAEFNRTVTKAAEILERAIAQLPPEDVAFLLDVAANVENIGAEFDVVGGGHMRLRAFARSRSGCTSTFGYRPQDMVDPDIPF